MDGFFLEILNMSITASWLIVAVIILRLLIRKAPKFISKILWGLVGIRLMCPFSFESVLSLIPSKETIKSDPVYSSVPEIQSGITVIDDTVNHVIMENLTPVAGASVDPAQILCFVCSLVWLFGIFLMLVYGIASYIKLRNKVKISLNMKENVYCCDNIPAPFIFGIFRPHIYIPSGCSNNQTEYIIAHEKVHIINYDHLWKPLGFIILSFHWFNPLVWVSYILLCKDIELACDEAVIRNKDTEYKKEYSTTLLEYSIPHSKMIITCPVAFGEVSVKERIKSVLHYKKPAVWIIVVAVVLSAMVAVGFMTSPANKHENNTNSDNNKISGVSEKNVATASTSQTENTESTTMSKATETTTKTKFIENTVTETITQSETTQPTTTQVQTTESTTQPTEPTTQAETAVKITDYAGTKSYVANKKLSIHIVDIDLNDKMACVKTVWNNKTGKSFIYGEDFFVYRKTPNGLVNCDFVSDRVVATVANIVTGGNYTRDITLYDYDFSQKGTYVLKFNFEENVNPRENPKKYTAELEFSVT